MHVLQEQKANEPNPYYALANVTKQHVTQFDTHPESVHARPAH